MTLRVLDAPGNERYRSTILSYWELAHAVIIVYDITQQDSLQNTWEWFDILRQRWSSQNVFTALVGNKADLVDRRRLTYEVNQTRLTCKLKFDCDSTKLQDAERLHEIASACTNQVFKTECACYPTAPGWVEKLRM